MFFETHCGLNPCGHGNRIFFGTAVGWSVDISLRGTQTEPIVEKKERKKGKESECLTECEESQGNVCTSFRRERILRGKKRIDSLSE